MVLDRKQSHVPSQRWRRRIVVLSALAVSTTSAFLVQQQPPFSRPASSCSLLSTVAPTALEQMTVKELRQLLKDSDLHQERGLLSRLKRKQDLVDYLSQHLPTDHDDADITSTIAETTVNGHTTPTPNNSVSPQRIHKTPLHMPPIVVEDSSLSPKDLLFEQLYERYPPLRDENDDKDNDTPVDVRQLYHPMLRNSTASDMDIVFVGTASCTPGTTRGVSCTALRLNWRRRCLPTSQGMPDYSSFTGGTWLFDVGECTQVCTMFCIPCII